MFSASLVQIGTTRNYIAVGEKLLGFVLVCELACTELQEKKVPTRYQDRYILDTARAVETSVTVNENSPIQNYVHPDDHTQSTNEITPGLKPFTVVVNIT